MCAKTSDVLKFEFNINISNYINTDNNYTTDLKNIKNIILQ